MSAPERIWASEFIGPKRTWSHVNLGSNRTEYVRADIAADLLAALEASRETHCGIAEHILQGGKDTKGIFADSQRARLAIDAAIARARGAS